MKPRTNRSIRLRLLTLAAALSLVTLGASHARAQAMLAFSGGSGAPLTLTLNAPVTYFITTASGSGGAPFFDFQGVGDVFGSSPYVSGTVTFTINGGAAHTFSYLASGTPAAARRRRMPTSTARCRAWRWATRWCSRPAR